MLGARAMVVGVFSPCRPPGPGAVAAGRRRWGAFAGPRLGLALGGLLGIFGAGAGTRRAPFLPLPPRDSLRWRMATAYGDEDAIPPLEDVVRFARWRREVMHL